MSLFGSTSRASRSFPVEASLLFEVLTDYGSYAEWMPFTSRSKLLAEEGDLAIAEFEITRPRRDTFAVECIHDKDRLVLLRAIGGNIPLAKIEWTLQPQGPNTLATVTLQSRGLLARLIPGAGAFFNPNLLFDRLAGRLAAYAPDFCVEAGGEKLIEIFESETGLEVWYKGKNYNLAPSGKGSGD